MMEELAFHIMDMAVNAIEAEAKRIEISIIEDDDLNTLTITVRDDGVGIKDERGVMEERFFTTKKGKGIGLGIPLLKGTAETCGGMFTLKKMDSKGTEICAIFDTDHPDLPPVGNLKDTFFVLIVANPEVDFSFTVKIKGHHFHLDTKKIKEPLDGVPISHPIVTDFLRKYMEDHLWDVR